MSYLNEMLQTSLREVKTGHDMHNPSQLHLQNKKTKQRGLFQYPTVKGEVEGWMGGSTNITDFSPWIGPAPLRPISRGLSPPQIRAACRIAQNQNGLESILVSLDRIPNLTPSTLPPPIIIVTLCASCPSPCELAALDLSRLLSGPPQHFICGRPQTSHAKRLIFSWICNQYLIETLSEGLRASSHEDVPELVRQSVGCISLKSKLFRMGSWCASAYYVLWWSPHATTGVTFRGRTGPQDALKRNGSPHTGTGFYVNSIESFACVC